MEWSVEYMFGHSYEPKGSRGIRRIWDLCDVPSTIHGQ